MKLKKEDVIKRIESYLQHTVSHPRLINVNNSDDMNYICKYFSVRDNKFKTVSDFSKKDENLSEDSFYYYLEKTRGIVFLTGFTSYYKLLGEQKLQDFINSMVRMSLLDMHLIVVCYQCESYLKKIEQRYSQFVYLIEGQKTNLPELTFEAKNIALAPFENVTVEGVQNIAESVETEKSLKLLVHTKKKKSTYPLSLYTIHELKNSYELLLTIDDSTRHLKEEYGTEQEWDFALNKIMNYGSWMKYIFEVFGTNLDIAIGKWTAFDKKKKWLYFIALKLYGTKNNWCLNEAVKNVFKSDMLVKGVFRSLLHLSYDDENFWNYYDQRKNVIKSLGNPDLEVADYCAIVKSKGQNTLYYLTDASKAEQNLIFENLSKYSEEIGRNKVIGILKHIYPDLYAYLQPYKFKIPLLDYYFQEYKYQKVVNKVFPNFLQLVEEQAEKREFNLLLPARSEKLEKIEKTETVVYFIDAMGVEYLSYIMDQCKSRKMIANTTLCRCELPSITSCNKEFVDVLASGGADFVPDKNGIKDLDNLKHHGKREFDFTNNELPTYISDELNIISKTIEKIATKLINGNYKRAILISDHGSSRLSVLSKKENKWGSESNAEHSGRCCPVNEIDEKPLCATNENGYWVLANYDRFKGGRKANIEVHGGATLEEVVVPIIEIVYPSEEIEVQLIDKNIKFSRHKKDAVIHVFSKTKLENLSIRIPELNLDYEGITSDGHTFDVNLPDLRKSKQYSVDVYYNNNLLKSGLKFTAENSDFSERKLI